MRVKQFIFYDKEVQRWFDVKYKVAGGDINDATQVGGGVRL